MNVGARKCNPYYAVVGAVALVLALAHASCLVYPCWWFGQTLEFREHSFGQAVYGLRGCQHCRLGLGQLLLGILFDCSCSGTGRGSLVGLDASGSLLFLCRGKRAGGTDR